VGAASLLLHKLTLEFVTEMKMATAKEQITELVQKQPDDSSYDEIIRELAFHLMIERGLKDSDEGRTISNEEMQGRIYQ
jgi:hypothetical protein